MIKRGIQCWPIEKLEIQPTTKPLDTKDHNYTKTTWPKGNSAEMLNYNLCAFGPTSKASL